MSVLSLIVTLSSQLIFLTRMYLYRYRLIHVNDASDDIQEELFDCNRNCKLRILPAAENVSCFHDVPV